MLPNKHGGDQTVWDRKRPDRTKPQADRAEATNQTEKRSRWGRRGPSNSAEEMTKYGPRLRRRTPKPDRPSAEPPDQANPSGPDPATRPRSTRRRVPLVAQDQALRSEPGGRPWSQPKDDAVLGAAFFGDDGLGPMPVKAPASKPVKSESAEAPLDENGFSLYPQTTGGSTATPGREQMGVAAEYAAIVEDKSTTVTRAHAFGQAADKAMADAALRELKAEEYDAEALRLLGLEGMESEARKVATEAGALREDANLRRQIASELVSRGVSEAQQLSAAN